MVDAVHAEGGKIVPQLWHVGNVRRLGTEPDASVPGYGPSEAQGRPGGGHGMTQQDIDEVVAAYAQAARDAKAIGMDGVELHGAHGYLIDQFFWEGTNQRTDGYGGSLANRSRFAIEVIKAVREAVGPDYPIIFRFSQWKQQDYTARLVQTAEELGAFLKPLSDAGVDIFHCSTRRFWEPEFDGSDLNLAGWTRKLTGKPTITVGSVGLDGEFLQFMVKTDKVAQPANIEGLLERLNKEEFDLVAVGRALLVDGLGDQGPRRPHAGHPAVQPRRPDQPGLSMTPVRRPAHPFPAPSRAGFYASRYPVEPSIGWADLAGWKAHGREHHNKRRFTGRRSSRHAHWTGSGCHL